jgi:hypothetical protein
MQNSVFPLFYYVFKSFCQTTFLAHFYLNTCEKRKNFAFIENTQSTFFVS